MSLLESLHAPGWFVAEEMPQSPLSIETVSYLSETAGRAAFRTHLRPKLAKLLGAIGLDVVYSRGQGDYLYIRDEETGYERPVLDMLGGFGAALFGHNHTALVRRALDVLQTGRPFLAQGSARSYAGLLAERLSGLVGQTTGREYTVTLANSGAEAVEAAIKHAELERVQNIEEIVAQLRDTVKTIRLALNKGTLTIPDALFTQAARLLDVPQISDLDELEFHLLQYNQRILAGESRYLVIKGAFHGKTTGALKLTHNPDFRQPWSRVGIQADFIPLNDPAALWQAINTAQEQYYDLRLSQTGQVSLVPQNWSQIVACLVEPIQGEGGIHELTNEYLEELRIAADEVGYPLIIDEIQTGMGRTGTFLASTPSGVRGDYYLLSKSLGGGLAKISALLIERERYIEPFGYIHTSTFADDDFSSAIALGALDLVEADGGALMHACENKGNYLLGKLRALQYRYPQVIKEVRGRGLMIGVELQPQLDSASALLRIASEQNLLSFLVCGYLLNEAGIRITPTLSANNTIRLEPSAYISTADLDHFCRVFEQVIALINQDQSHKLVRFMIQAADSQGRLIEAEPARVSHAETPTGPVARRVACIAHFMRPEDLVHWDPTLAPLTAAEADQLLEKAAEIMEPFIAAERIVTSPLGERISLTVIGLPFTSTQIMDHLRNGNAAQVVEQIEQGVAMAKKLGCTQIGFTGYTSIATNNCQALIEDSVGLTSGNSLTAAAALEATHLAAQQMGIEVSQARLGIVGGVGNIGRVLAEIEAEQVESLLLVGRAGAQRRLVRLAEKIYTQAWQRVQQGDTETGLARVIAQSGIGEHLNRLSDPTKAGKVIYETFTYELGEAAPIQLTTEMADLRTCDMIITATNAPEPLIYPEHLSDKPTVICDVSVPADVHPDVLAQKPQVRVLKGGVMQLPQQQNLAIGGMALAEGQSYACITEVILLGLAGVQEHFSYGPLQPERVRQISQIARQHQFSVLINEVK